MIRGIALGITRGMTPGTDLIHMVLIHMALIHMVLIVPFTLFIRAVLELYIRREMGRWVVAVAVPAHTMAEAVPSVAEAPEWCPEVAAVIGEV